MKIKLISMLALMLALFLCITACEQSDGAADTSEGETSAPSEETTAPGDSGTDSGAESETGSDTGSETEPSDPYEEAKANAKAALLALMQDDGYKISSESLFAPFIGDYTVDDFTPADASDGLNRIWQKGDVTVLEYDDGTTDYHVFLEDHLVNIYDDGTSLEAYGITEAEGYVPSVFDRFSVDISTFYSPDDEEDAAGVSMLPEPDSDSILVNDDGTVCTLSDAYMEAFVRKFCESNDYTEDQILIFLSGSTYSGTYTVEDNALVLTLQGTLEELGDIDMTITISDDEADGPLVCMDLDVTATVEGIPVTVMTQLSYSDIRYEGDKLVGATMRQIVTSGTDFSIGGVTGKSEMTELTEFVFDCTKDGEESVKVTMSQTSLSSFGETVEESSFETILEIRLDAKGSLKYGMTLDGEHYMDMTADIVMTAPETVPSEIEALAQDVKEHPDKYFGEVSGEGSDEFG